ncbi:MAG: class I SAM-dependent methyltransferase [Phycicoccus sp.]
MTAPVEWLERWDAQQETTVPDREERFEVIVDLVEAVAGPRGRVLDLACGPASLGVRVLRRLPHAQVVGVDGDPVLLALAAATVPPGLDVVEADLRDPSWVEQVRPGPYDAVVSTTAMHWLHQSDLRRVYAECHALLRPGGLLVNGDNLSGTGRTAALAEELDRRRRARHVDEAAEGWSDWWSAIGEDPAMTSAVAERERRAFDHPERSETSREVHERALRDAGFAEVEALWRKGTDTVLVAVR